MGKKQEDLLGIGVFGDPGLNEAVRKDALGIGFNNINYAYDATTLKPMAGTAILPIDLNDNGKIDADGKLLRRPRRDHQGHRRGQVSQPAGPRPLLRLQGPARTSRWPRPS